LEKLDKTSEKFAENLTKNLEDLAPPRPVSREKKHEQILRARLL
jgi:hypothetical protein